MRIVLSTIAFMFILSAYSQDEAVNGYFKYIDSADATFDAQPQLATTYLDSIPEPVETTIKGQLAEYFHLRGLISDRLDNRAELFHNFLMALKYAKIEKNYDIAGIASIELFYNTYFIKKDSTAFTYLDDAETYFQKSNNLNRLAEVQQMHAYVELYNENYTKSNALILKRLQNYKDIKDDGYYYMYALFLLSSNYIHLEDLNNSHKYFNRLKTLKRDSTISKHLHNLHKVSIYGCLAEYHLNKNTLDSTEFYLDKSEELRSAMNTKDVRLYFKLKANYYEQIQDIESKANYIDSLSNFEVDVLNKTMSASLKINESLEKTEDQLESESYKKRINRNLVILLLSVLSIVSILFYLGYKKFRNKTKSYLDSAKNSSNLKSSHEKLKVKVVGLEQYILKIKDDVKSISAVNDPSELRKNIKDLYKNIHLKSSTELANGENHLDLINELNVEFFNNIKHTYPQLNESEIIICYYIFTGFKNKEIASFLNVSVRSVESKRYRISKKININSNQTSLAEQLQSDFKNSK